MKNKYRVTVIIILLWLGLSFTNTGFINADLRGNFKDFKYLCKAEDGRSNLAWAVGMSLIPLTWIATPLMTGFYQYGWTLEHGAWGGCLKK